MRIGLLADIHGNLEALEAALARLEQEGATDFVCLGDVVGYNADPQACLAIVRERCSHTIKGNHERMVLGLGLTGIRPETLLATEWTRQQLDAEALAWIEALPDVQPLGDHVLMVHGSPRDPDEYILSTDTIREAMSVLADEHPGVTICLYGHTHFPMVIGLPEIHMRFHETKAIDLDPKRVYLINPGSVGQPRDGCPLSSFALLDTERPSVTIFRVPYDMEATQRKVRAAGLGDRLADRLALGR